ncbi:hypothetical protein E2C01_078435 [Portunus trituberculatus]|uniref:Uncharacterized protein n=1 Tax=Portunus trituberculatus TaxID=210409 RepID=A0A5B7INU3_PORTR|nr:hypothetical protein [Portunus trituberculatus]
MFLLMTTFGNSRYRPTQAVLCDMTCQSAGPYPAGCPSLLHRVNLHINIHYDKQLAVLPDDSYCITSTRHG